MTFDDFVTHKIDFYMGKPKSGKTLILGSYPKPLLYISVGNDGGGRVLKTAYPEDIANGNIRVKNLKNDLPVNGKIQKTSIEKLAEVLAELRKDNSFGFKTIAIDTVGGLQDDYKDYMIYSKQGKSLTQQEWGDISKMMLNIKDVIKRFSEDTGIQFVLATHTREQEVYETSGLNKEIRIVPDLTISTGVKYMKDASNIFYCCRKTVFNDLGDKEVKFLTYVGPHPLMDTGTRDLLLPEGKFVENFSYEKFATFVKVGKIDEAKVFVPETTTENNEENNEEN